MTDSTTPFHHPPLRPPVAPEESVTPRGGLALGADDRGERNAAKPRKARAVKQEPPATTPPDDEEAPFPFPLVEPENLRRGDCVKALVYVKSKKRGLYQIERNGRVESLHGPLVRINPTVGAICAVRRSDILKAWRGE